MCNCGGRKTSGSAANLSRSTITLDQGVYQTANPCTVAYYGDQPTRSLIVVAAGTENEQWFGVPDRMASVRLARENKWTWDQLPATSVCHNIAVEVLGS